MIPWAATICPPWKRPVLTTSVVLAVLAAMAAVMVVMVLAVVLVAPLVVTRLLLTVATKLPPLALTPLSAFVRLTRPLQQRTVKENKHAATCTPQVP